MALDKRVIFTLACLFAVALAALPPDPVFECLSGISYEARDCYKQANGFSNSHRGGRLGNALRQLVPKNWWNDTMSDRNRARACITSLKSFVAPLIAVMESEQGTQHDCKGTGNSLSKTLSGLKRVLTSSIFSIRRYVRHKRGVQSLGHVQLKAINMTTMTSFAAQLSGGNIKQAVRLRNFVLLDYLDKLIRVIYRNRPCFNTHIELTTACTV